MTTEPLPTGAAATDAALDRWVADAEAMAAKYQRLSAEVSQVSVAETTPDGLITATVDAGGLLTDLRIADRATDLPGARLAAAVLWAMRKAQSRIAGRVGELMRETVGEDTAMTDAVLSRYHDTFPAQEEPTRADAVAEVEIGREEPQVPPVRQPAAAPAPVAARARGPVRRAGGQDDWDGGESFLEEVDR